MEPRTTRDRGNQGQKNPDRAALLTRIAQARADRAEKPRFEQDPAKSEVFSTFWPSVSENDARLFDDSDDGSTSENVADDTESTATVNPVRRSMHTEESVAVVSENNDSLYTTKVDRKPKAAALGTVLGDSSYKAPVPGRRRLCKARPEEPAESLPRAAELAAARLIELPSDSSESNVSIADVDDGIDDVLVNKLGGLSLTKKVKSLTEQVNEIQHKVKPKILDTFSLSSYESATSCPQNETDGVQVLDDDENSNFEDASSSFRKETHGKGEDMVLGEGRTKFVLPAKVQTMLYPHQREGIRWLWGLHLKRMGGILGDDMGLGKTMQIAAFLYGLIWSRQMKRALIVAPKTLLPHWEKELTIVGLGREVRDYSGTSVSARESNLQRTLQAGGVLLTTYDIVRHNFKALSGGDYGDFDEANVTWDYLILDEGHLIKNPTTQRAKSLKEIPSGHRIIISGTPIQNNLREMWALYYFCCPELLGDRKEFKAKYENLILSGNDKHASDRQKRIGSAVAQELRERIAPYFLRRMKSEIFPNTQDSSQSMQKLAKKNDIIVWLRLTKKQRQMYTAFLHSQTAHQSLEGSALAALTILKKICDHPLLLTKRATDDVVEGMEYSLDSADAAAAERMRESLFGYVDIDAHHNRSCKIVFLMALLENLVQEGHRTLVFSQSLKMLNIIQEEVSNRMYNFRRIDGKFKSSERQETVEEFQSDSTISIFLLTSQVGGLGLTLTGADRVVIVDPAWNPSKDNQSVDRAYRIGQDKDVIVYRLMTCGTLEEKIYRKQVFKGGLMKVATEKKEQYRYFSQQDLRELLTVPKTGFDISPTQQQLYEEHAHQFQQDEKLAKHIKFLESLGIAGVSHHDLLFSKAAPDLPPASEDEVAGACGIRPSSFMQPSRPRSKTAESNPNDSASAYQPQSDYWKGTQRVNLIELDDSQLNTRRLQHNITRLSSILSNPDVVSKLPDRGENIRKKVKDLEAELEATKDAKKGQAEYIDVDAFSSSFNNLGVHHV